MTTSTHTVTVEWNDYPNQPTGPNVVGLDADSLTWPSGRVDLFSRLALAARGIEPPRTFKPGDWVRWKMADGTWSISAMQIHHIDQDGIHLHLTPGLVPPPLLFVAEGEVPE